MTLDKALELLTELVKTPSKAHPIDTLDAIKLGIEALKLHKQVRESGQYPGYPLLPGETKD